MQDQSEPVQQQQVSQETESKASNKTVAFIIVGVVLVIIGGFVAYSQFSKGGESKDTNLTQPGQFEPTITVEVENENGNMDTMDQNTNQVTELQIEDIQIGDGEEASSGARVTVNYTGTLTNGEVFDSSVGKAPFTFTLGVGQVIKGWDIGVEGMKVGGKRKLTIPADLAYGSRSVGSIPANSTLIFEVDLLSVE